MGSRSDVASSVLAASDAFVFPSRYEGFGGAALEALAAGLPIIASDLPALREVLAETAVFVPKDEPAALGAAITGFATDGRRPPVAQAQARAQLFDIGKIGELVAEWLDEMARQTKRHHLA